MLEGQDRLRLARDLVAALEAGERADADRIVEALARRGETGVYRQVATMTGDLRQALGDLAGNVAEMPPHEVPNVTDRLHSIIAKTERAAHRTISAVEALLPMAERIAVGAEKLIEDWSRIEWEGLDSDNLSALRDRVIAVVQGLRGDSRALHERLCDILIAQDYQDLTGQVITRVIALLQEVEAQLAAMASWSAAAPDGVDRDERAAWSGAGPEVVTSQDEVDELLKGLGR
jgi:chemotaxis protein CheZ